MADGFLGTKEAGLRTLLLLVLVLFATDAYAQIPQAPKGIALEDWQPLMTEIDKGQDPDDPGKMVRYWKKADSGTLTASERVVLETLVKRRPKRGFGPDGDVYMSIFAAVILSMNDSRVAETAKQAETDKQIGELKKAVEELRRLLDNKTATLRP